MLVNWMNIDLYYRYTGSSPESAKKLLDKCQNERDDLVGNYGHPRGHASDPDAVGNTSSVENYSRTHRQGWKTGFLSRDDQNVVANSALNHEKAQNAMDKLNNGGKEVKVEISASSLDLENVPQAAHFNDGERSSEPMDIKSVVLILRHFKGKSDDKHADVYVQTFYPTLPKNPN